jgi:hypothetical protein
MRRAATALASHCTAALCVAGWSGRRACACVSAPEAVRARGARCRAQAGLPACRWGKASPMAVLCPLVF